MKFIFLAVLLLLAACARPVPTKPAEVAAETASLKPMVPDAEDRTAPYAELHADTDFTSDERSVLDDAARVWKIQTGGLAVIKVVYDLDFGSLSNLQGHIDVNHNTVVRYESDMDTVKDMDANSDGKVLGWVGPAGGIHNPGHARLSIGFVTDRFRSRQYALSVVIHEFGHVLGLPHIAGRNAVMYPAIVVGKSACLKAQDLATFCDIYDCSAVKTIPCE